MHTTKPNHPPNHLSIKQEAYGREYYEEVNAARKRAIQPIMWKAHNVTHALVHAATAERQRPYVVVGMDGRFMMSPLLLLPRRCVGSCGMVCGVGSCVCVCFRHDEGYIHPPTNRPHKSTGCTTQFTT